MHKHKHITFVISYGVSNRYDGKSWLKVNTYYEPKRAYIFFICKMPDKNRTKLNGDFFATEFHDLLN